jgi:hypothetical protein
VPIRSRLPENINSGDDDGFQKRAFRAEWGLDISDARAATSASIAKIGENGETARPKRQRGKADAESKWSKSLKGHRSSHGNTWDRRDWPMQIAEPSEQGWEENLRKRVNVWRCRDYEVGGLKSAKSLGGWKPVSSGELPKSKTPRADVCFCSRSHTVMLALTTDRNYGISRRSKSVEKGTGAAHEADNGISTLPCPPI